MPEAPLLSICIPAYNLGEWTRSAVTSALSACRGDDVEVVVCDDGSTDETLDILTSLEGRPNLRVLRPAHLGMVPNFNRAVRASRGRWVTVLGADDELLASYFEHLAPHAGRSDVAALGQLAWMQWRGSESPFGSTTPEVLELERFIQMLGGALCISTTAFRRDLFDLVGGFDDRVGSFFDFDFLFRIADVSGLPIEALGVAGGRYYPLRGATWTRHEEAGEASEMMLHWIRLRTPELGPVRAAAATRALADRARAVGRAQLATGNPSGAARHFQVATECSTGVERLKNRVGGQVTRLPVSWSSTAARAYTRVQRYADRRRADHARAASTPQHVDPDSIR